MVPKGTYFHSKILEQETKGNEVELPFDNNNNYHTMIILIILLLYNNNY